MFSWWPFSKHHEDPVKVLEGLKTSFTFLNERFALQQISNEEYLKRAMKMQKDIDKYEKKIAKLEQHG